MRTTGKTRTARIIAATKKLCKARQTQNQAKRWKYDKYQNRMEYDDIPNRWKTLEKAFVQ